MIRDVDPRTARRISQALADAVNHMREAGRSRRLAQHRRRLLLTMPIDPQPWRLAIERDDQRDDREHQLEERAA